jgi:hypothetical protein
MVKLKVDKEKILHWYADHDVDLHTKQLQYYLNNQWYKFINYEMASKSEKNMFDVYFEIINVTE